MIYKNPARVTTSQLHIPAG